MKKMSESSQKLYDSFFKFGKIAWGNHPPGNLKRSESRLLYIIGESTAKDSPGVSISMLSRLLRVASPTVTQLVNNIEESGLVTRTVDPDDRRSVHVKLTEKGETLVRETGEQICSMFAGLVNRLGEEKSNQLAGLMGEVFEYFNEIHKKDTDRR